MANTTNLNLSKLAGTEKLKSFPSPYNDNMDAIDDAFGSGFGVGNNSSVDDELNGLGKGMAIIANGNTHAAITSGQYVYVRQHGSLSEGLYKATANISANGTLSGSNLTAVSSGGLNDVYSTLNSKITSKSVSNPDLDEMNTDGYFSLSGTIAHAPRTMSYAQLYVLNTNYTWKMQILTNANEFWYRGRSNTSSNWSEWVKFIDSREPSVTAGTVSTLPTLRKNGTTMTLELAVQLPAGSHGNGLWTVFPAPSATIHFIVGVGQSFNIMRINSNGTVDFNNTTTFSSPTYIVGSVTYPIA